MNLTLNPTSAAMLAEDDTFDLLSPSPFADIADLDTDPFTPTCTADLDALDTLDADALNEEGDSLFDLLDYDPFAKIGAEVADTADAANDAACRACCPYHGPHEVDEDGNALPYCERCEGNL